MPLPIDWKPENFVAMKESSLSLAASGKRKPLYKALDRHSDAVFQSKLGEVDRQNQELSNGSSTPVLSRVMKAVCNSTAASVTDTLYLDEVLVTT